MKHINESIIGRRGMPMWPNPYGLTKEDAIGKIEGYPLEIITLALYEIYSSRLKFDLGDLQRQGLNNAFVWDGSKDGWRFWKSIFDKNFDIFYKTYSPTKLKEIIEK